MVRACFVAVGVAVSGSAHAEVQVDHERGPCSGEEIRRAVDALGPSTDDDRIARVDTRREGKGIVADVTLVDGSGKTIGLRTIEARSCKELATSVALVIVVSLADADAATAPEPATVEAVAAPDPTSVPPRRERVVVHETARATTIGPIPESFELSLGADADLERHAAIVAGMRWRRGWLSVGLEVNRSTETTLEVGDAGRVHVARTFAAALSCGHLGRFGLCGVAAAGMLTGRGELLADASTVRRLVAMVGARAEWTLHVAGLFGVQVHVDGLQALRNSRFLVDQMPVWSSQSRELRVGLGVVANFP